MFVSTKAMTTTAVQALSLSLARVHVKSKAESHGELRAGGRVGGLGLQVFVFVDWSAACSIERLVVLPSEVGADTQTTTTAHANLQA